MSTASHTARHTPKRHQVRSVFTMPTASPTARVSRRIAGRAIERDRRHVTTYGCRQALPLQRRRCRHEVMRAALAHVPPFIIREFLPPDARENAYDVFASAMMLPMATDTRGAADYFADAPPATAPLNAPFTMLLTRWRYARDAQRPL
jgi:hypothetical protein